MIQSALKGLEIIIYRTLYVTIIKTIFHCIPDRDGSAIQFSVYFLTGFCNICHADNNPLIRESSRNPFSQDFAMQPVQQQTWTLPDDCQVRDLYDTLAEPFSLATGPETKVIRRWYDTFDWRLFRAGRILIRQGTEWILQDFDGRTLFTLGTGRKVCRFASDFPASPLADELKALVSVRALLELGRSEIRASRWYIVNDDEKRVALLDVEKLVNSGTGRSLITLALTEVRGYSKWFKRIAGTILKFGGRPQSGPADILSFVLEGSGRTPLDYSSGYNVPLEPDMASIEAAVRIHSVLLEAIRINEPGVLTDTDIEFLHDLRVAVRRTRSALVLMKGVFAPAIEKQFKQEFKYIGQITGPVRDLDVYLASREEYMQRVPFRLQTGLGYFFEDLTTRRKTERRKLVRALKGERYQRILADWRQLLATSPWPEPGKRGELPVKELAGQVIHKRFRRVLADGEKIDPKSPDESLHRLRIECKKLRYSLEFFTSLYDEDVMRRLVRHLKLLQNNLGDFNDLSVQQDMLAHFLSTIRPGTIRSREMAASIGGLMTDLSRQHREVRTRFEETFARFARKKNLDLYTSLFA